MRTGGLPGFGRKCFEDFCQIFLPMAVEFGKDLIEPETDGVRDKVLLEMFILRGGGGGALFYIPLRRWELFILPSYLLSMFFLFCFQIPHLPARLVLFHAFLFPHPFFPPLYIASFSLLSSPL
ncbi:hypothetical protein M5110_10000, partial [Neisseria meningitidis]|nr:hypothetical protein [Neisseria meningitidis]